MFVPSEPSFVRSLVFDGMSGKSVIWDFVWLCVVLALPFSAVATALLLMALLELVLSVVSTVAPSGMFGLSDRSLYEPVVATVDNVGKSVI